MTRGAPRAAWGEVSAVWGAPRTARGDVFAVWGESFAARGAPHLIFASPRGTWGEAQGKRGASQFAEKTPPAMGTKPPGTQLSCGGWIGIPTASFTTGTYLVKKFFAVNNRSVTFWKRRREEANQAAEVKATRAGGEGQLISRNHTDKPVRGFGH